MLIRGSVVVAVLIAYGGSALASDSYDAQFAAHAAGYGAELQSARQDFKAGAISPDELVGRLNAAARELARQDAESAQSEHAALTAKLSGSGQEPAEANKSSCLLIACGDAPVAAHSEPVSAARGAEPHAAPTDKPRDNQCLLISCE